MTKEFGKTFDGIESYSPFSYTISKKLGINCAVIYGTIYNAAKNKGYSFMSVSKIAFDIGTDRRLVQKAINELLEYGLIIDVTLRYSKGYKKIQEFGKNKAKPKYHKQIKLFSPNMEKHKELVEEWNKTINMAEEPEEENIEDQEDGWGN
jgi:predicted transcriptional regulator